MKPRILLTGPTGQIGWEVHQALAGRAEVFALDRKQLDLSRPSRIAAAVAGIKPHVIVNAAGYTEVDKAEHEPELAYQVNRDGPAALAREAQRTKALLVHYSTDYVFDGHRRELYPPGFTANPINVYGQSKFAGEQAIRESGARALILRTSWVYSTRRKNFLLAILRKARQGGELRVVDDQFGCPTSARVIAQATAHAIDQVLNGPQPPPSGDGTAETHHVCGGGVTTWFEFARSILELARFRVPPELTAIHSDEYPTDACRPFWTGLDCTSFEERFNYELPDWRQALNDLAAEGLHEIAAAAA